jgi:hypothetical protein
MERLNLFQEPFQPAAVKLLLLELGKASRLVGDGVMRELGSLDEICIHPSEQSEGGDGQTGVSSCARPLSSMRARLGLG